MFSNVPKSWPSLDRVSRKSPMSASHDHTTWCCASRATPFVWTTNNCKESGSICPDQTIVCLSNDLIPNFAPLHSFHLYPMPPKTSFKNHKEDALKGVKSGQVTRRHQTRKVERTVIAGSSTFTSMSTLPLPPQPLPIRQPLINSPPIAQPDENTAPPTDNSKDPLKKKTQVGRQFNRQNWCATAQFHWYRLQKRYLIFKMHSQSF